MDAWAVLTSASTIQSGDAWEHINAQGYGAGGYFVLVDGMEVETMQQEIEAVIDQQPVEVLLAQVAIDLTIDQAALEVEV